MPKLIKKEARITPLPMMPVMDLDKALRPSPLIKKPINGNSGTRYTKLEKVFIS
jgi:hypothetical protein